MGVFRCYTEKPEEYDMEAKILQCDLREFLGIQSLDSLRILNRYDVEGISPDTYLAARETVFSEPQTSNIYDESPPNTGDKCRVLVVEALPGQYDQRADACVQCLNLLAVASRENILHSIQSIIVKTAKVYMFYGDISDIDMAKLRSYIINPVESREASQEKPVSLVEKYPAPEPVETLHGFVLAGEDELFGSIADFGLAMDMDDLRLLQSYFRDTEKRDPTATELRVIDTYWSDHCRHTTFFTHIANVSIDDPEIRVAYESYLKARNEAYGAYVGDRPQTLMDIATIAVRVLRKRGMLTNIDISEEVNACSIRIDANVNGITEDWLLMFKNETHNHPTEAEPFGGAATCIGGAIRDPMSGRARVYQAMRITGAGDPLAAYEDTLPGKIPQKKLTTTAAQGYSSYGTQMGLAAGFVHEIYHPGYIAKRMELGAVAGAVRADSIRREVPLPGDKILLVGGRTGRDGIGGATGSSKTQTDKTLVTMAAEVQKGNAAEELKIQRLFSDPDVLKMIKKCNDFGAGGVSVAVGELADGLDINLSLVRCKYDGLDGTELAISESQERMAVVVSPEDAAGFIMKAEYEDLEAYVIADVTDSQRVIMRHNGEVIANLSREFLSTNGAVKSTSVSVQRANRSGTEVYGQGDVVYGKNAGSYAQRLTSLVGDLRFCSQLGLNSMFDDTAGASSVLVKNGGKTRSTPVQAMAALLPTGCNDTTTCSVMAYGYDPFLSSESPFKGARTSVIISVAKLVASGCDPEAAYLTFQEYFERLGNDPLRWGKPFSALLGAFDAQMGLELAAIGGKDSMSGSFNNIDVPPALVSFAIAPNDASYVISPEFKQPGHDVVMFVADADLSSTKKMWIRIRKLIETKVIISAWAVTEGGAAEGIFKMTLGNEIGFETIDGCALESLFCSSPGSIIAEATQSIPDAVVIGRTISEPVIRLNSETMSIAELRSAWESPLEPVFPTTTNLSGDVSAISYTSPSIITAGENFAKPRALIITLPGSNGELDTARAISRAGGIPEIIIVRTMTPAMLEESIAKAAREIEKSQIIIISGGFSFGDEPDGSAKLANLFFRTSIIADATHEHLKTRKGLMLGINNGFQALLKLGLIPYGEIVAPRYSDLAMVRNAIGRYQAGYYYTRVASVHSPWMNQSKVGDIHAIAVSHGEGRLVSKEGILNNLASNGQVATQYTDADGNPSMDTFVNPNGSMMAVEGLFSPDGSIFGKMGHTDRYGEQVAKNIYGNKFQPLFESGVIYFK